MENERELSGSFILGIKCDGCDEWTHPEYVVEIAGDKICESCEEIVAEQMWNDHYDEQDSWENLAESHYDHWDDDPNPYHGDFSEC